MQVNFQPLKSNSLITQKNNKQDINFKACHLNDITEASIRKCVEHWNDEPEILKKMNTTKFSSEKIEEIIKTTWEKLQQIYVKYKDDDIVSVNLRHDYNSSAEIWTLKNLNLQSKKPYTDIIGNLTSKENEDLYYRSLSASMNDDILGMDFLAKEIDEAAIACRKSIAKSKH